ncbi:YtcA family lipoprotein [Edaphobacter bradus]|uniref:YtcA family lipoprotein n=1 Tax=Edaphobacter bradus TaxID=2259016 RepID=UPI0021E0A682|nr:YtcA family lipoprotein [Edaphobacter bradus]
MTRRTLLLAQVFCLLCTGCGRAPAFDIIGSFFPVWIICLTIAVILASILRIILLRYQFEAEIGPVALFYPSVVILLACLLWLIFFH